jgi:hypothetical protein
MPQCGLVQNWDTGLEYNRRRPELATNSPGQINQPLVRRGFS